MTPATINITAAEQVGDYALRLSFDDGTVQTVGDYGLCFPIADLYRNRLMPDAALEAAA